MIVKTNFNPKGFKPIEIVVTIESEEELCDLWHRINTNSEAINPESGHELKHKANDDETDLWDVLDELVSKLKLRK